jgi:hypothetical protein
MKVCVLSVKSKNIKLSLQYLRSVVTVVLPSKGLSVTPANSRLPEQKREADLYKQVLADRGQYGKSVPVQLALGASKAMFYLINKAAALR